MTHSEAQVMPTITYLKHEISISPGSNSAHVVVDGARRCFLRGLDEAKRFLRERKIGPYFGPRQARYEIVEDGERPRVLTSCVNRAIADSTLAYYRADAERPPTFVRRTEVCPVPGCDGYGEISERVRQHWTTRVCACHVEAQVYDEREESQHLAGAHAMGGISFRYQSLEKEGLWTSEPFPPTQRHEIVRGVRAGFLMGRPRWALDLDGNFIFGLDGQGREIFATPKEIGNRSSL